MFSRLLLINFWHVYNLQGLTNDASQISSVSPEKYAQRFVRFMDANID